MTLTTSNNEKGELLGPLLIGLAGAEVSIEEGEWLRHPAVGGVVAE